MYMVDNTHSQQAGFALLVSLMVVSVVVSIGLVILDVTIKQLRLSTNSTDSEIAFHAANAGMECARFWRREERDTIEGDEFADPVVDPGGSMSGVSCFGAGPVSYDDDTIPVTSSSDGEAFVYEYEFSWAGDTRCSEIDMVVAAADIFAGASAGNGVTVDADDMVAAIPGYPAGEDLTCAAGSFCTVISVKGYNRGCGEKNSFGTVQREVLLEL